MSKELLTELRCTKEAYKMWKQGQVTQEKYRHAVQSCRDGVKKAKTNLELNLSKNEKDNKQDSTST